MPFYEIAEECTSYHANLICPVGSCKKNITQKQAVFVCSYCSKFFHPPCKGIIGAAKIKKAAESNWFCSPDCCKSASSVPVPAIFSSPPLSAIPPSTSRLGDTTIHDVIVRMDAQFAVLKSMITDLQDSQNFISREFDVIKFELKRMVENNSILNKKCESLEEINLQQDARILNLEFKLDGLYQQELNAHLFLVGLPDKVSEPELVVRNLFNTLQCEDSIYEVKSCDYVTQKYKRSLTNNLPDVNQIIIKFKDTTAKSKVVQLKKKLKPTLIASDIGFSNNTNNQLYFRDNLTPLRYRLFREARVIKKSKNFKYLWVNNGSILLREAEGSKIIRIESKADLNKVAGTSAGSYSCT